MVGEESKQKEIPVEEVWVKILVMLGRDRELEEGVWRDHGRNWSDFDHFAKEVFGHRILWIPVLNQNFHKASSRQRVVWER